jgi:large subunit ribosomal protein L25
MATGAQHVQLAKALPPRLLRFLARYPPPAILPAGTTPEQVQTPYQATTPNPFLPNRHPVTGRLHDPIYSRRRQADLVKMARVHGVEELLPFTPKGTEERLRRRVELGLRVKGTGVGQRVKGHKHEREILQKYVGLAYMSWIRGLDERLDRGSFPLSVLLLIINALVQDGEEAKGHAGDAQTYHGMEIGKSCIALSPTWNPHSN